MITTSVQVVVSTCDMQVQLSVVRWTLSLEVKPQLPSKGLPPIIILFELIKHLVGLVDELVGVVQQLLCPEAQSDAFLDEVFFRGIRPDGFHDYVVNPKNFMLELYLMIDS